MNKSKTTIRESTREFVELSVFIVAVIILLISLLGLSVTNFYMAHSIALPAITLILVNLQYALTNNIFFILPLMVFVIISLFLLESFAVEDHIKTYDTYKKINLFLIVINVLILISIILPIIRG